MSKRSSYKSTAFILASASPRRKELMHHLNAPFIVRPSSVNENIEESLPPLKYVQTLATRKATAVSKDSPNSIILGADTVVVHQGDIIGKPENTEQARLMIQALRNSTHRVLTGISLNQTDKVAKITNSKTFCESTRVTFGDIRDELIENYVTHGHPLDKAGGYGIQDRWGAIFTKRIEGDFYNVMGLPVHELYRQLRDFAPTILD